MTPGGRMKRTGKILGCLAHNAVLSGLLLFSSVVLADPLETGSGSHVYHVAPGDRLTVTVIGQPELSGDVVIDDTGTIALPLVGAIDV